MTDLLNVADASDAEIVAAVRSGALLGDRVDLALRFGRHILDREPVIAARDAALARVTELEAARAVVDAELAEVRAERDRLDRTLRAAVAQARVYLEQIDVLTAQLREVGWAQVCAAPSGPAGVVVDGRTGEVGVPA